MVCIRRCLLQENHSFHAFVSSRAFFARLIHTSKATLGRPCDPRTRFEKSRATDHLSIAIHYTNTNHRAARLKPGRASLLAATCRPWKSGSGSLQHTTKVHYGEDYVHIYLLVRGTGQVSTACLSFQLSAGMVCKNLHVASLTSQRTCRSRVVVLGNVGRT